MKKNIFLLFLLSLILPMDSFCQVTTAEQSNDARLKQVAKQIISDAGLCTLITLDKDGIARARAMDAFVPEEDFTVWFGTISRSRKVEQIRNDPRVTLYYEDSDASGYVMIYGEAELVNDSLSKEKHWKDAWDIFYPNKAIDYLLIKVNPKWMEVLSDSYDIKNDSLTWEVQRVVFEN